MADIGSLCGLHMLRKYELQEMAGLVYVLLSVISMWEVLVDDVAFNCSKAPVYAAE
jgi:hypothetical protein